MQPFYALIIPQAPATPGQPPGIWGGAPIPWPTPPIHYPPGIWGGSNEGFPTHPIAPGGPPPGIWGGGNQPFPTPPIPIYPGGTPNPPGIWGPNDPRPGWGLPGGPGGGSPPGTWGGSGQPFPTPPIVLPLPPDMVPPGTWGGAGEPFPGWGLPPPELAPPELPPALENKSLVLLYVPGKGWKVAVIPTPGAPGNFPPHPQPVES